MKVLVHAANLKSAGGLTVALNFLKNVNQYFPSQQMVVLAPANCGYEQYQQNNIVVEIVPQALESPIKRIFLDKKWIASQIKKHQPDVLFTMGNFAIPTHLKQAVLFHYPYAIYPDEKKIWEIFDRKTRIDIMLRVKLMGTRFKYASIVVPQTETAAARLRKYFPKIKKIGVVPNAYTTIKGSGKSDKPSFFEKKPGNKYLLSLSRYYPHKNLEILLEVGKLVKDQNLPFTFIVTIDEDQHPAVSDFINNIVKYKLEKQIINLGNVPMENVPDLYQHVDALVMPTLVESFSTTYADAMFMRKTVFTSERDFALEVCKDAAYYFDPLSAENILKTIVDAYRYEDMMNTRIGLGYQYSLLMADWEKVTKMYLEVLENLVELPIE